MEDVRRNCESAREEITTGVATFRALIQDPDLPAVDIRMQLPLVNGNYIELKACHKSICEDIDDDEFGSDLAASYEFDAKVIDVRMHLDFVRPSVAFSHVVAKYPRARNPGFAVFRHDKTTELSGEGKMFTETEKVVNVHAG